MGSIERVTLKGVLAMFAGIVYTRLLGMPQACRPHHSAGGDDAGQWLPSIQGRPSLCPELAQAISSGPYGNTGMYIVLSSKNAVLWIHLFCQQQGSCTQAAGSRHRIGCYEPE